MPPLPLAAALVLAAAPALACPVPELVALAKAPLAELTKVEFDVAVRRSAEGGRWQVHPRPDGRVHSSVRTDFGETGKAVARASFLDAKTFAITVTEERYAAPIGTPGPLKVASRTVKTYLFCERERKILGVNGHPGNPSWLKEAREERRAFEASELAPYLKKVQP